MVTLSLFRHAKSAWGTPGLGDFDRPLASRGQLAAPRMGAYMEREGLVPDLALCSSAVRARQTLELAHAQWERPPEIRYEDSLYGAGPSDMLRFIHALPAGCGHAMLVGHNPGMHSLAIMLSRDEETDAMAALELKFPSGALAVIEFGGGWGSIAHVEGRLRSFMVPRDLQ